MTGATPAGDPSGLLCTVRGCAQPLAKGGNRFACANRHSFDLARSGYLNLLQPQDRRSRNPGDSKEAVAARRRFLDAGHAAPLLAPMRALLGRPERLLDAGCGEGHYLAAFEAPIAHGVDISVPAIDAAAKRHRQCFFVVANADRFLPYADASFDAVMSITARVNGPEFRRVLRDDGQLLVALPGPDDLIELREAILGDAKTIERSVTLPELTLVRREKVRHVARLDLGAIRDVMTSSYRAMRTRERERMERLSAMDVTLSRDLLLFR